MASFDRYFEKLVENEGGFKLINVKGDTGGQTYCGISRNNWPGWAGWKLIDNGITDRASMEAPVRLFYIQNFWDRCNASSIDSQNIAEAIVDFAINAGEITSIKLAQIASGLCGKDVDGKIGKRTLDAINGINEFDFLRDFALSKMHYYLWICNNRRRTGKTAAERTSQDRFLVGWGNRALAGAGIDATKKPF